MDSLLSSTLEHASMLQSALKGLWQKSKFFRILSLITGSISGTLTFRYLYINAVRKYRGLAPGLVGMPLIGHSMRIFDRKWLSTVPVRYGPVTSVRLLGGEGILINDPVLAKKFHSDPRAWNSAITGPAGNNVSFAASNGKPWSDRRKIISSNLMSTMKAEYVEISTKQFIASAVFTAFDHDISNGLVTDLKPVFRPIGFNIVLKACFGKKLNSVDDPLWTDFEEKLSRNNKRAETQIPIAMAFGFESTVSLWLQRVLTNGDLVADFDSMIDVVAEFENAMDLDVEKDENVRLFNDFVDDYVNGEDQKYTKRNLLGDMFAMFTAAIDTTYAALSFAVLALAEDQKLQQQLHEEVVKAFGNDLDRITLRNGGNLKISKVRAFIQLRFWTLCREVLRVYAPVASTGFRKIIVNGMKVGEYNVAKGTMPLINASAINRNPKYWIKNYDAEKHCNVDMDAIHIDFWLEDGVFVKKLHSDHFFAFHTGKRDCVGQSLAMKELLIVLTMILMKYEVHKVHGESGKIESKFGGQVIEPTKTCVRLKKRN